MYILCRVLALLALVSLHQFTSYGNFLLCYVAIGVAHTFWGFYYGWNKYGSGRSRDFRFMGLIALALIGSVAVTFLRPSWGVFIFSLHHITAEVYFGPERTHQSSFLAGFRLLGHFGLFIAITAPLWQLPPLIALGLGGLCLMIAWCFQFREGIRRWSLGDDVLTMVVCAYFVTNGIFASPIDPVFYHILVWTIFYGLRSTKRYWIEQGVTFSLFWVPTYLAYQMGYMGEVQKSTQWLAVVIIGALAGFVHVLTTPLLTTTQPAWVNRLIHGRT